MPITIYKINLCPPSRAALMMAELLKLNYQTQEMNCMTGENMKPEFIEKNPLHTIPLLVDGDFILADSHAIITYLVSKYGADMRGELYPSDLALRATIDQRLFFDATALFPPCKATVIAIFREKATGPSEKQTADINEGYGILETYLEKTRFVACDYLTLADVSIVATVSSSELIVPINEKYVKVRTWLNRLKDEVWYRKANVPGLKDLSDHLEIALKKNSAGM